MVDERYSVKSRLHLESSPFLARHQRWFHRLGPFLGFVYSILFSSINTD